MSEPASNGSGLPYPPATLRERVGWAPGAHGTDAYDAIGLATKGGVVATLPGDWSWEGKRVLDFGCGAGRMLRHLLEESQDADIWGCDIHAPSVDWILRNLPFHAFCNTREPRLGLASESFDLVVANSVFTHIGRDWARWLLELRRILRDGGLLFATFLGPAMISTAARADWDPDLLGMTVLHEDGDVPERLPNVLHSPWWIREHWGRGFDVVDLSPRGFAHGDDPPAGAASQGWALLRRAGEAPTVAELEAADPDEPRELPAAVHSRNAAWSESETLVASLSGLMSEIESLRAWTAGGVHDRDVARHDRDVARYDRDVARDDREVARRERDLLRHDRDVLEARLSEARERLAVAEAERERIAFELASVYAGGWWRLRRQVRPLLRLASATRRTRAFQ